MSQVSPSWSTNVQMRERGLNDSCDNALETLVYSWLA